jgi:ankyrin repeat protein
MSCAVKNAPMKTVELLLERGGDIKKGQLIHHTIERGSQDVIEMLDLLLQKGAQLNKRKYEDHWPSWNMLFFMGLGTPLHGATRARKLQVVDYLLRKGADLKVKDSMIGSRFTMPLKTGFQRLSSCLGSERTSLRRRGGKIEMKRG